MRHNPWHFDAASRALVVGSIFLSSAFPPPFVKNPASAKAPNRTVETVQDDGTEGDLAPAVASLAQELGQPSHGHHSQHLEAADGELTFALTADPTIAAFGDTVQIIVEVTNRTGSPVWDLDYSDTLEDGFVFDPAGSPGIPYDAPSKTVTFPVGLINPGMQARFHYSLRVRFDLLDLLLTPRNQDHARPQSRG